MTGRKLVLRIALLVTLGALSLCWFSRSAEATPISPNQLVSQPAGLPGVDSPNNPSVEDQLAQEAALRRAAVIRANKSAMLAAAVPDARTVLAIIAAIFLLRALKAQDRPHREMPERMAEIEKRAA